MAELIEVKRKGGTAEILVDGVPIPPHAVKRNSVYHGLDQDSPPTISLELYATHIVIDDDMRSPVAED